MGLELGTLALIGSAVAAGAGTAASIVSSNQQRAAGRHAADVQEQAQSEQRADNAAKQAQEARQQVRDQRIRQARIEQAAVNTGTEGSSGELGAISSIATQGQVNTGFNLGAIQRGNNISIFNQEAADSLAEGRDDAAFTQNIGSIFSGIGQAGTSYYNATKGVKAVPGTT